MGTSLSYIYIRTHSQMRLVTDSLSPSAADSVPKPLKLASTYALSRILI